MEVAQNNGEVTQSTFADANNFHEDGFTFVFQNEDQENIRTIPADILQRYPNCMLTRMVNSHINTRRTADGGYIIKNRNLEMIEHVINFMQSKHNLFKDCLQLLSQFRKHFFDNFKVGRS